MKPRIKKENYMENSLIVNDMWYSVSKDNNYILQDINIIAKENEIITIVGPSGSGKTTLLKLIAGLLIPSKGDVHKKIENQSEKSYSLSMVSQEPTLFPWLTAFKNISFGMDMKNIKKKIIIEKCNDLLALTGLEKHKHKYPHEMSGGMKQRVTIARALSLGAQFLLLDEPFSALDPKTKSDMHKTILNSKEQLKRTVILVTHNIDEAVELSDRVYVLSYEKKTIINEIDVSGVSYQDSQKFKMKRNEILDSLYQFSDIQ